MMIGNPGMNGRIKSLLRIRTVKKEKRTIIFGLKSDNQSREMLIRLLSLVVMPGDNVLAVHVQEPNDFLDANTFHIHEDLCKSKQVDFQVKICVGNSYITELSYQVRINSASVLALGCNTPWPKDSTVKKCLKALPPTCSLLVMDNGGKILVQKPGISQNGSASSVLESSLSFSPPQGPANKVLQYSLSSSPKSTRRDKSVIRQIQKSLTMPSSSTSSLLHPTENAIQQSVRKTILQLPDLATQKLFQKFATLESKGCGRQFTIEELKCATNNFSPEMVIGEGGHSKVYRANLGNGNTAAVKVLKPENSSEDDFFREVEMSSGLKHENIVQLLGYCYNKDMQAMIYNLLKESLNKYLKHLRWNERIRIAIRVAKAVNYLHSCSPPVIHRDVKSSNILLSDNGEPQLSDFGAAIHRPTHQVSAHAKPSHVIGTFGYMAPEYMMYGKIDEKIDVYSYGVVLLELITGKEAIQTNQSSNQESLVLWARSLLSSGLYERLIDPYLDEDYNKDEMKTMITAARLCLLHSSSRRPSMKTLLRLFEEPENWLNMQRKTEELLNGFSSEGSKRIICRYDDYDTNETLNIDDE